MIETSAKARARRTSDRLGRTWYFLVLLGLSGTLFGVVISSPTSWLVWVSFAIAAGLCVWLGIRAWHQEAPSEPPRQPPPWADSILTGDDLSSIVTVISAAPSLSRIGQGETALHTLLAKLPKLERVWLIGCQQDEAEEKDLEEQLRKWIAGNLPGRDIHVELVPGLKIDRFQFSHRQVIGLSRLFQAWSQNRSQGLVVDITLGNKITSVDLWLAAFYAGLPVTCQITHKERVADKDIATETDQMAEKRQKREAFALASATIPPLAPLPSNNVTVSRSTPEST